MSQITPRKGTIVLLLWTLLLFSSGCSDRNPKSTLDPDTGKHITGWSDSAVHGTSAKSKAGSAGGFANCQGCHQDDFTGGIAKVSCFTCHGVNAPHSPAPWRAGAVSATTHTSTDESNAPVCALCHAAGANSSLQPATAAPAGTAPGCFNNTLCHAVPGHTAGWSAPDQHGVSAKSQANGFSSCQSCHGSNFAGLNSAPSCLQNSLCHGAAVASPHPPKPWRTGAGSARTHTDTNQGNAAVCALCHTAGANMTSLPTPTNPAAGTPGCFNNTLCHGQAGHAAGWASPSAHGASAKTAPNTANMTGFSTCQTCHGTNFAGGTATTCLNTAGCHGASAGSPHAASPWAASAASAMTHTTTDTANAGVCGLCHLANRQPPSYAVLSTTVGCFDNTLCHGSAASIGCVTCHASVNNAPNASVVSGGTVTQRRNIVSEFAATWSHKRAAGGTVNDEDCVVCHMEGDASTKNRDMAYHGNGYIELRDPDTGTQIQGVTWNNATPGSYVSSGATVSFVRFSRDLGVTLESDPNWLSDAAIQINQCLKCHDADGALSANSRVTTGTALKPFNTTVASTGTYYLNNIAAGNTAGSVVDVNSSFDAANASYHPVRGRQNNSYVDVDRMKAPWDGITKTAGNNTSYGLLMSCWDCHAPDSATGVQSFTVTAHGAAATLRKPVYLQATASVQNLCTACHNDTYATSGSNHGTGSAFSTGGSGNIGVTKFGNCWNCHSSFNNSRPWRGVDAHGFNTIAQLRTDTTTAANATTWSGARGGSRPYAFIRTTNLGSWRPLSAAGDTLTGTVGCSQESTGSLCNNGHGTYSPGGTY